MTSMTKNKRTAAEHLAQLKDEYRRMSAENEDLSDLREEIAQAEIEAQIEEAGGNSCGVGAVSRQLDDE